MKSQNGEEHKRLKAKIEESKRSQIPRITYLIKGQMVRNLRIDSLQEKGWIIKEGVKMVIILRKRKLQISAEMNLEGGLILTKMETKRKEGLSIRFQIQANVW